MLNQIAEIIAGKPTLDRLNIKLAQARDESVAKRAEYRKSCLDIEDGAPGAVKRKADASKALLAAEEAERDVLAAIDAATERARIEEEEARAAETQRRWKLCLGHVEAREKAGQDIVSAIASLADATARFNALSASIRDDAPGSIDHTAALAYPEDTENSIRLELVRMGFAWAARWPWGSYTAPSFETRASEANGYIKKSGVK